MINPIPWITAILLGLLGKYLLALGVERLVALFAAALFCKLFADRAGRWKLLTLPMLAGSFYLIITTGV